MTTVTSSKRTPTASRARRRAMLGLPLAAAIALACTAGGDASAKCGETRTGNVTIRLLATAENVGEIDECGCKVDKKGGFPRRLTFVDSLREANEATLLLDAGDWADINPVYGKAKTEFIAGMMSRVGYDAMTYGRRELELGWDYIRDLAGPDGPPILASNLLLDGERVADNWMIRDVGCVRVGVFGLVGEAVVGMARADDELSVADVYESADRVVHELETEGCEVIVMLAQTEIAIADSLLRRRPEIDVAVLGYHGGLRRTHALVGESIVVRPGRRGQYMGILELEVDPAGTIVAFDGESLALGESIRKDPEIDTLVKEMLIQVERLEEEAKEQAASDAAAQGT